MTEQKLTMVKAINQAFFQEMESDESVVVLGEDVGVDGGVFRVTEGLIKKFGEGRVIDTPIAEMGIAGTCIGMAIGGLKPVGEIQFDGFSFLTLNQMFNHAAHMRWRSRGGLTVPMVLRFPYGGGIRALEHHSEAPETYYAHTPGLKVVIPSNPVDAKGLLISSIRDPDPVVYMEPKRIYRAFRDDVPEESYTTPIGEAKVVQEGTDLTLVTFGAMTRVCMQALKELQEKGKTHSVELIDLRTIAPLDRDTVINSVKKTGRFLVVHEARKIAGFGAELIALVNEKAFMSLEAPPMRVTAPDIIYPFAKSEHLYMPDSFRVRKAIEQIMNF
jgi:pyruvate dehydrogenase E1 component beta subunit